MARRGFRYDRGRSDQASRVFESAAVEKFVADLATMKVQQPDGSFLDQAGTTVEPLQLQVVCRGLWDRLAPEKRSIAVEDVTRLGNVTEALATYYADELARIAEGDEAIERECATGSQTSSSPRTAPAIRCSADPAKVKV